jgi:ribonuclease E
VQTVVEVPSVAPAQEVAVTPVAVAATPVVVAPEPAATAEPIIVTPAPVAAPIDLGASLQNAGLVMIETSSDAPKPLPVEVPAQALGRKPKPAVAVVSEPLQMVETRNNRV